MRFSLASFSFSLLISPTFAVLYGDESYGDLDGKFWSFYSGGVAVIDPETCSIENVITTDNSGLSLPAGWSDGIYMQYFPQEGDGHSHNIRPHIENDLKGYILINSRINRDNDTGDTVSDVYIFNTETKEVESVVEVGPRVVHSYGIHNRNEFWTHSDGDGHFYVIDLTDIDSTESKVKAHVKTPFHGKLLWDEDGSLGDRGFATATGETHLFEVEMANAALVRSFDFSNQVLPGSCFGLHAIAYSKVNQHVYAECVGGGGTLEFDVRGGDIQFVHQHVDQTGALYEVPDGSYIVASNKGGNKIHVFKPNGNGVRSSLAFDVNVPGHPATPAFYPTDSVDGGADFIACMPLTGNPNKDQIDPSTGEVTCDYYNECTGPRSVTEIFQGVCLHSEAEAGPDQLTRVTEQVSTDPLCNRCANSANFVDGSCVCTPDCGSCDEEFEVDLSKTGVACIDLGAVVDGTVDAATLIPDAGAVKQGNPYGNSKECTYGRTYRSHKRGQKFDASVSNFPFNSIVIVDMSTQRKKCQVEVLGSPSRIVWVPNKAEVVSGVGPAGFSHSHGDTSRAATTTTIPNIIGTVLFGVISVIGFELI